MTPVQMDGARDGMEDNGKKQLASNNLVIVQLGCWFATVWPGIDEILLFYNSKNNNNNNNFNSTGSDAALTQEA